MMHETELKEKLQALAQNEFRPSADDNLSELIPAMLRHIGSTDSELRDDLIYSGLGTWILHDNALSQEQLRDLLPVILDDQHMLYKIGERDTDSVFTRSFSILVLPLLLIAHRERPLFSPAEIDQIKQKLLYYLENERDRRGFVPERGWAHAIAHAADALDDLAQCTEMDKTDLIEILAAIRKLVCFEREGYTHAEDERLVTAVLAVFGRGLLSDVEITQWIEGFSERVLTVKAAPEKHIIRVNAKNFLQSLYFRLGWEQKTNPFAAAIDQELRRINPFARPEGS
jgi:hypothetical protein